MKKETNSSAWLSTFLAGFLATVLGILLTFGVQGLINSGKRNRTARLLAEQTVEKMDRTYQELHEYLELYNSVDSTIICLNDAIAADTLDACFLPVSQPYILLLPLQGYVLFCHHWLVLSSLFYTSHSYFEINTSKTILVLVVGVDDGKD